MSSNSTGDKENPIGDKKLENISNYLRLSSLLTITDFRRMARSLKTYMVGSRKRQVKVTIVHDVR